MTPRATRNPLRLAPGPDEEEVAHRAALARLNAKIAQAQPCPQARSVRALWMQLKERWNAPHQEGYYERRARRNREMQDTIHDLLPVAYLVLGVGLLCAVAQAMSSAWWPAVGWK
jgi:hypothetical protein